MFADYNQIIKNEKVSSKNRQRLAVEKNKKETKKPIQGLLVVIFFAVGIFLFNCNKTEPMMPLAEYESLQQNFITPHESNTVWCYYYWINDDISLKGITKDMEAMKEFGIGGLFVGNINPANRDGRVPLFSEEWWDITVHTVKEGHRLGIDVGFFNSPGWSQSGGPWISHDKAMRHMVYSETAVTGPATTSIGLKKPAVEFQDTYVLAFRSIGAENIKLTNKNARVSSFPVVDNPKLWLDNDPSSETLFDLANDSYTINIAASSPITARSIIIHSAIPDFMCEIKLQAKVNDNFQQITSFTFDRRNKTYNVGPVTHGPVALSIPETYSSEFKLLVTDMSGNLNGAGFSEIIITEAQVFESYIEKTLGKMHPTPLPEFDSYFWNPQPEVNEEDLKIAEVINISSFMDANGLLTWDAPEGSWTVLRMGMTPTGTKNAPAAPQGTGYEVDKMNSELVAYHFEQFMGEIIRRVPEESLPALKYCIADSYEMGPQNWTDGFEERFEEKFGYNPVKYLPVYSGRIVGSVEESERFLWDIRRAVADDVACEYVGGLREVANENGLKLWLENYGHWGFPSEFLMYGGQSDLIGGEYWNEGTLGNIECKAASSSSHIYGKPVTSAECFTSSGRTFVRHPAMLKKRGDWGLTEGINHHVLHVYIHQPDDDRIPGVNAWFGTEFNRHNTWFKQGKAYIDYIRRAQHLLQQGNYVADLCYFIGENAPIMTGATIPELPKGYTFDFINTEVIMKRLSVKDGKFVLPDGMSYRMMVLPPLETMRPELLAKLEELVSQGGIIYGNAPESSPSLQNYPQCDKQVQLLASKLWAGEGMVKTHGEGAVVEGISLQEALDYFQIEKNVMVSDEILWTHRSLEGMEIYFLTNQSGKSVSVNPSFRVSGLKPQLWDAVTGEIRAVNKYKVEDGRTIVPLFMEVDRSWFVIFTNETNQVLDKGYVENFPEYKTVQTIDTRWFIDFENKKIAPKEINTTELTDWTKSTDDLLKYYSGAATYSTTFDFEMPDAKNFFIDLGKVGVMATVILNGKNVGTTWMTPFRLNITGIIKERENTLQIKVVNVWRNRLTGDKTLPEDKRTTSVLVDNITPEEELIPSGLMGPVSIQVVY
jgi:hypothetical protein